MILKHSSKLYTVHTCRDGRYLGLYVFNGYYVHGALDAQKMNGAWCWMEKVLRVYGWSPLAHVMQ